ncbi:MULTISPECIES: nitroreductase family protein [unclassified Clostridium]|uniref:Oxidoreductase n=1 Tax=Clostridium sulfidigenes TaxID=318464 RepID=A0A927ZSG7_9CLOT|nr:oxidoreductase [Clostridium sulfidigenes]HAR84539.1 oxidoreductase [Clostridium sp.]HBA04827.1 oxidoreductase [Clostridium sp.]
MELLEVIQNRRSIRKFKPDEVPEEYIHQLIEAGRLAPSGTNLQPARYIVIKSEEARTKLKDCTPLPFVSAAPAIIACCVDTNSITSTGERMKELKEAQAFVDTPLNNADENYNKGKQSIDTASLKAYLNLNVAIAIDHITLRATDLGLGSCWVMMFDKEKVKALLNLEDRYDVLALLPIGYPDQTPKQRPRLDYNEVLLKEI